MNPINKTYRLQGKVQHYAWGGFDFIPALLGIDNSDHKPCAEYWMGAHPGAPSVVVSENGETALNRLIQQDPETFLGKKVNDEFGELPYLFKVLDVKEMLSIQVHPTRVEAEKGFDAEESAGIPINAPDRNYKDRNHKPEVMVALSEFWLLHGFKTPEKLQEVLTSVPEFNFLLADFHDHNYYQLYKTVMELPQQKVDEILLPLAKKAVAQKEASPPEPAYWVARLFPKANPEGNLDRGIFSIYFFNIVHLQPGQAVFQGAGIPHAYLQGQNIELMANSDNVLRGGLTPKHIDVPELLKHTSFTGIIPDVLDGTLLETGELNFPCPVKDFAISAINLQPAKTYSTTSDSAEIFIVTEGAVQVGDGEAYKKGESFLVTPATRYTLTAIADATLFKAFVPA